MQLTNLQIVFSEEQIAKRVAELAVEISKDYGTEPVVVVCVLKGAFYFFADLTRKLTCPVHIDFVRVASYANQIERKQTITFSKDVETRLEDKHVLLVEDIVDTGHTVDFLQKQFSSRGAKSLRIATLIDKKERREVNVSVDYVGFSLKDGFVIGYGLDYAEKYRELPCIYTAELIEEM